MKRNFKLMLVAVTALTMLSSCFEPKLDTPEKLLQHYVYLAFAGTDDKDLEKHLTANFINKIKEEQSTNPTGARQISFKNLKLKNYKMLNKMCEQENVCQLRFEVSYEEKNATSDKVDFQTETKKLAIIKKVENNEWRIDEIDHLKTFHDMKTQIDVPLKE